LLISSNIDSSEVGETLGNHDLGNTQPIGVEWSDNGGVGVGVLNSFSADSWVDQRYDTTESGRGWESGIRADRWNADNERVEVLLSGDEAASSSDSTITSAKFGNNVIGLCEFATWVCRRQKELDRTASKGGSLSTASKVGKSANGCDGTISLLLTKTSLSNGCKEGEED
jgi:hypothetical protein